MRVGPLRVAHIGRSDPTMRQHMMRVPHNARIASVECLRLVASLGIVWFHAKAPGDWIGYGGLPALIIIACSFAGTPHRQRGLSDMIRARLRRLGLPWIFWSAVYGVSRVIQIWLNPGGTEKFAPWMLLVGPSLHLWYLPFGIACSLTIYVCAQSMPVLTRSQACLTWSILATVIIVVSSWGTRYFIQYIPLPQWIFGTPAVAIGLSFAAIRPRSDRFMTRLILLVSIVSSGCAISFALGFEGLSGPYAIGVLACAAAWPVCRIAGPVLLWGGSLSFGIYLVHPLVLSILTRAIPTAPRCLVPVVAFAASGAITATLLRTRFRCFV